MAPAKGRLRILEKDILGFHSTQAAVLLFFFTLCRISFGFHLHQPYFPRNYYLIHAIIMSILIKIWVLPSCGLPQVMEQEMEQFCSENHPYYKDKMNHKKITIIIKNSHGESERKRQVLLLDLCLYPSRISSDEGSQGSARLYFFPQWLKSQAAGLQILKKIHSYAHICIIFFILSFLALLKPELFFMALGKGKGIHYKHFYKYFFNLTLSQIFIHLVER